MKRSRSRVRFGSDGSDEALRMSKLDHFADACARGLGRWLGTLTAWILAYAIFTWLWPDTSHALVELAVAITYWLNTHG
jgi:hypothetical protein